jgi:hypothetical protein
MHDDLTWNDDALLRVCRYTAPKLRAELVPDISFIDAGGRRPVEREEAVRILRDDIARRGRARLPLWREVETGPSRAIYFAVPC